MGNPAIRTTINTHRGLFQYTRLQFGVAAKPAIFERTMESLLGDLPHVGIYLDDIIVMGESETALQLRKCTGAFGLSGGPSETGKMFTTTEVEYVGHWISAEGIHPVPEKVTAIREAPILKNNVALRV